VQAHPEVSGVDLALTTIANVVDHQPRACGVKLTSRSATMRELNNG